MSVHPKTSAAGAGSLVGVAVAAVLQAAGVHLPPEAAAAISGALAFILSYLTASPPAPPAPASGAVVSAQPTNRADGENWT